MIFKLFKVNKVFGTFRNKNKGKELILQELNKKKIKKIDLHFYFQFLCKQKALEKDERNEHNRYIYNSN